MKRIDFGQTISILANLGVLIGILLLVFELNQNRQMMRSQTRSSISETLVDILVQQSQNAELTAIRMKVNAGEPLTALETMQYRDIQNAFWRYRENVNYQFRNGLYDEEEYIAQREQWRRALSREINRAAWCQREEITSPAFVAEINGLLEKPCE